MPCSSAAWAPRSSLLAFHLLLSRMPSRSPSNAAGRGAMGVSALSTRPRGSKTKRLSASSVVSMAFPSDGTNAAGAVRPVRCRGLADRLHHRRVHVPPTRDEGGEPPGMAADHEQVNVVRARHDGDT